MSATSSRFFPGRGQLSTPPGLLRALSLAILGTAILLALFASSTVSSKSGSIEKIGNHTVPSIIDSQRIHAALLDADRNAANSYLYGGEGTDPAHTRYLADLKLATEALEQAAQHTAYGDEVQQPLVEAMSGLNRYTALVERARANSRLGYPVGQAYLTAASKLMHDEILPAIDRLDQINVAHLDSDYAAATQSASPLALILGLGVLELGLLVFTQVYIARRFRRLITLQLAVGTVLLVVFVSWTGLGISRAHTNLAAAKESHYAQLHRLWSGRSQINDANLNGTLSLIARGSGADFDAAFQTATTNFDGVLTTATAGATTADERQALADVRRAYQSFLAVDARIRQLAAAGQRNEAVQLALGTQSGQLGQAFGELDAALDRAIAANQQDFDTRIAGAQNALDWLSIAGPLVALLTSLLAFAGVQPRVKEYGG